MYADPARLRGDAAALTRAGNELTLKADRLVRVADTARWQSSAADGMRRRVRAEAGELRAVAEELAAAGSALRRHAAAVEAMEGQIRSIEQAARSVAHAALAAAGSVLEAATHGAGHLGDKIIALVDDFPPQGDVGWLEVPGRLKRLGIPCRPPA